MNISVDLFEAFIKCSTKCWLRASGEPTSGNAYAEWVKAQNRFYRDDAAKRLIADAPANECEVAPVAENLGSAKWRLAVGMQVCMPFATRLSTHAGSGSIPSQKNSYVDLCPPAKSEASLIATKMPAPLSLVACLHAVERLPSAGRGKNTQFTPIRFVFTNKLTNDDRLLLAFDSLVLSEALGRDIAVGQIIHGDDHTTVKVKTSALAVEVRKRLEKIAALLSNPTPPDLVLNRHCAECEFQSRCRQKATEKDDLSLLAGMSEKGRMKLRSKGIFTVTQLSFTFKPRRRPKRLRDKREQYHHSLKALAIRENKIHIVGTRLSRCRGLAGSRFLLPHWRASRQWSISCPAQPVGERREGRGKDLAGIAWHPRNRREACVNSLRELRDDFSETNERTLRKTS